MNEYSNERVKKKAERESLCYFLDAYENLSGKSIEVVEESVRSVVYYGFHSLRHFMASHLADQARTRMKVISGLLRHKNLKTTEIYLHPIDENQRSSVDRIKGKFTSKNDYPHTGAAHQNEAEISKDV